LTLLASSGSVYRRVPERVPGKGRGFTDTSPPLEVDSISRIVICIIWVLKINYFTVGIEPDTYIRTFRQIKKVPTTKTALTREKWRTRSS